MQKIPSPASLITALGTIYLVMVSHDARMVLPGFIILVIVAIIGKRAP